MSEIQSEVKPPVTADDVNDFLKTVDGEEKVAKSGKEVKEDKADEKEIKEPKDDEEEIELKTLEDIDEDEKLDLESDDDVTIDAPPRKQEILKKYPDLFKDFKFLEKMIYRDRQYSELFGSFDDAKEIAEKSEIFNNFEKELLSGKTEDLLKNVKDTDPKAFDKIVDSYLPTLAKVDKEAYFEVVGNIGKQMILEMVKEANEAGNEDLKQAALLVNQFLFGTSKFVPAKQRVDSSKTDETSEAEKERLSYIQERYETATNDLQGKVDNILKSTISDYIDPKDAMSAYVKKNAINDALKSLHASIGSDSGLHKNLDRLWRAAADAKFSKESLGRIQSFYLGKAKGLLPSAIKKARAEALKDLAPRIKNEEKEEVEEEKTPQRRGNIPPGRPSQPKKTEMKRGETVAEFFGRD